jgi:hypothetical protein
MITDKLSLGLAWFQDIDSMRIINVIALSNYIIMIINYELKYRPHGLVLLDLSILNRKSVGGNSIYLKSYSAGKLRDE